MLREARMWPCDLRIAHGPHNPRKKLPGQHVMVTVACDGVRCHPNTMIGRSDVPTVMVEVDDDTDIDHWRDEGIR